LTRTSAKGQLQGSHSTQGFPRAKWPCGRPLPKQGQERRSPIAANKQTSRRTRQDRTTRCLILPGPLSPRIIRFSSVLRIQAATSKQRVRQKESSLYSAFAESKLAFRPLPLPKQGSNPQNQTERIIRDYKGPDKTKQRLTQFSATNKQLIFRSKQFFVSNRILSTQLVITIKSWPQPKF
jgi:hypothetical protein